MNQIILTDEVAELLEPIEGDSKAGVDAKSLNEFFKLNMEIGKISPDYKICVELSTTILKENSKDLWVASWLCFSWFRTDGIEGFKNGLSLLLNLLQKFGENIYPEKINHRSKAVQYLNSDRFFKLLEKEEITNSNAQAVIESEEILNALCEECSKQFPDNLPALKNIKNAVKTLTEDAAKYVKQEKEITKPISDEEEKLQKEKETNEQNKLAKETKPQSADQEKAAAVSVEKDYVPKSDKESILAIRKHIKYLYEDTSNEKKLKVPQEAFIYLMSRSLVWGQMNLPPSNENVTQIAAPNSVIQNKIGELYSSNNWDVLIPRIELNLLNTDSGFLYWLDVQRYVVKALEQKGGAFIKAGKEIKYSLALLLAKFPQLTELKFKNKETPFADNETIDWINNDVSTIIGSSNNKGKPLLLPPIMGEDYNSISEEYVKSFEELPENFEVNIAKMQQQVSGDTRRKGRFLRQLNLANLCVEAKQFKLAKVHLLQLIEKIEEYNLAEWEPALSVAVWQSTYLVNNKLLATKDKETITIIETEQAKLFAKIANYDGVLAIKLSNKNGGK